jgi:hypothetical protein
MIARRGVPTAGGWSRSAGTRSGGASTGSRSAPRGSAPPRSGSASSRRSGPAGPMRWPPASRAGKTARTAVTEARAAVVRRLLPAPPEVVDDGWLDPAALADWMCPRPAVPRRHIRSPRRRSAADRHRGDGDRVLRHPAVPGAGPAAPAELHLELLDLARSAPQQRGDRAAGAARAPADPDDDRAHAAAARARRPARARLGGHRPPARRRADRARPSPASLTPGDQTNGPLSGSWSALNARSGELGPMKGPHTPGAARDDGLRRLSRLTWRATQLSAITAVGFAALFARTASAHTASAPGPVVRPSPHASPSQTKSLAHRKRRTRLHAPAAARGSTPTPGSAPTPTAGPAPSAAPTPAPTLTPPPTTPAPAPAPSPTHTTTSGSTPPAG